MNDFENETLVTVTQGNLRRTFLYLRTETLFDCVLRRRGRH